MKFARVGSFICSILLGCSGATAETNDNPAAADIGASETGDDGSGEVGGEDTGGGTDDTGPVGPSSCELRPACDAPLPALGAKGKFDHTNFARAAGAGPNHRGRDLFVKPGGKQWALAKFAYGGGNVAGGIVDDDAQDELVDIWLLRDCATTWNKLGSYRTTSDKDTIVEEGVINTGGRIYVDIASVEPTPLGVGRHRVLFVMKGDNSTTEQFIEVLPPDARIVISDIDGTLTSSESASFTEAFGLAAPNAHPGSAEALTALARRGYYMFYMTARPEWFVTKTRKWLADKNFPPGIMHTGYSLIGETGSAAINLKTSELAQLKARTGVVPSYGFGNTETDAAAYDNGGITPASNRYFYKATGDLKGGTYHEDYAKLVAPFSAEPAVCPATK